MPHFRQRRVRARRPRPGAQLVVVAVEPGILGLERGQFDGQFGDGGVLVRHESLEQRLGHFGEAL